MKKNETTNMSKFESIFSSKQNADSNLSNLFKNKDKVDAAIRETRTAREKLEDMDSENDNTEVREEEEANLKMRIKKTEKATKNLKGDKKIIKKRVDPESEKRTIFIGNLHKDCKKNELLKLFKVYGKIESKKKNTLYYNVMFK